MRLQSETEREAAAPPAEGGATSLLPAGRTWARTGTRSVRVFVPDRDSAEEEEEKVLRVAIVMESSRRGVAEIEGSPETKKMKMVAPARRPAAPTGREHKCNECGRSFATGQALGGHKRKHWKGLPAGVRSPEFDLNSPAAEREEEEGPIRFHHFL